MRSFFIKRTTKKVMKWQVEFLVSKHSKVQGIKKCCPHTCTGSNPAADIKQRMLGATGHYFIKILAERAVRNPVNFSKLKQNKRESIVIPNFKSIVQSYWMLSMSL